MKRGYRRYRGSRRVGCLIPTLVILCILAAGVLIYLNKNLAIGTDGMVLKLPFSEKTVTFGEKKKEDVPIIIEDETKKETAPEQTPEQPKPITYEQRQERSVFLPKATVLDAAALDAALKTLQNTAVNTVVLEVKAEDGTLALATTYESAADIGVNAESSAALAAAVKKVSDAGFAPVAQISCFRDNKMSREHQQLACRTKKRVIWLDYDRITWLNPYVQEARDYLKTVIDDAYSAGFREVLLTNLSFPVNGKTSILYYSQAEEQTKQAAMQAFYAELAALAEQKGDLHIAAKYDNYSTAREQTPGGQALSDLAANFYRIVVPALDEHGAVDSAALESAAAGIPADALGTRLVPLLNLDALPEAADIPAVLAAAQQKNTGCALFSASGAYPAAALPAAQPEA